MLIILVFLFSLLLIFACFFTAFYGKNWNFQIVLSLSSGILLSLCFLEFLPQSFQSELSMKFNNTVLSHHWISIFILSGVLLQALADIYLLPYLSFFDRFLETKSNKKVQHSHTFSPISVCSVTGCLSICSFFDGIRLLTAFGMDGSVAVTTAFALFFHLLSEGVLIAVFALSSGFKKRAIGVLVGILAGALMAGAFFAEFLSRLFSFQALLAFSSGCLLYICFVHLLPFSLKSKKGRFWFFGGLILFSIPHFFHG